MTLIDEILADVTKAIRPALEGALARVRDDAKREAASEFKAKLAAMLDDGSAVEAVAPTAVVPKEGARITYAPPSHRKPKKGRASPGTVKPQILGVLANRREGITTREVAEQTGFKYNSVRGTLWLLKKEGHAANRDEKWFPVEPVPEDSKAVSLDEMLQ